MSIVYNLKVIFFQIRFFLELSFDLPVPFKVRHKHKSNHKKTHSKVMYVLAAFRNPFCIEAEPFWRRQRSFKCVLFPWANGTPRYFKDIIFRGTSDKGEKVIDMIKWMCHGCAVAYSCSRTIDCCSHRCQGIFAGAIPRRRSEEVVKSVRSIVGVDAGLPVVATEMKKVITFYGMDWTAS